MRRTILLIYALLFVTESLQAALVPLLPRFAHEFGLSDVETGSLLSAATLATVVIGVPIGILSDRLGAKSLAVAAAFIVGTAAIMQGLRAELRRPLRGPAALRDRLRHRLDGRCRRRFGSVECTPGRCSRWARDGGER
ncbi:MAG: MFS transporter, partial [Gaiellaceae bacterium]